MHPIESLHKRVAQGKGALPVITHIDAATGSRIELSVATLLNNVAKTAHLLLDDALIEPGHKVLIDLPPHWQSAVWIAAAWSVGAQPISQGAADVAITTLSGTPSAAMVYATGLHPFGMPLSNTSAGVLDWAIVMRSYPDFFSPDTLAPVMYTHRDAVTPGARVALVSSETDMLIDVFADVLAHSASLVLITNSNGAQEQEFLRAEDVAVVL